MTATTTHAPIPVTGALPSYRQPQRVTQVRVVRAEWTKLRTQPSAYWALLVAVILVVGFGIGYSLLRVARPPHGAAMASFDPAAISLSGVQLAQIAVGVLGVLLVTSEVRDRADQDHVRRSPAAPADAVGQGSRAGRRHHRGQPARRVRRLRRRPVDAARQGRTVSKPPGGRCGSWPIASSTGGFAVPQAGTPHLIGAMSGPAPRSGRKKLNVRP
jgi:hypothetical protein